MEKNETVDELTKIEFSLRYYNTLKWLAVNCTECRQFVVSLSDAKKVYEQIEYEQIVSVVNQAA